MSDPEPAAHVRATAPAVRRQAPEITFRIWHHLADEGTRALLFEHGGQGEVGPPMGLVEALLAYFADPAYAAAIERPAALAETATAACRVRVALVTALADVLGPAATPAVLEAWAQLFVHFVHHRAA